MTNKLKKTVQNFTKMVALISRHPVQESIAIHFHPCNPVFLPQTTHSILFYGMFFYQIYSFI